jgi:pyroglutamyl-peptidase
MTRILLTGFEPFGAATVNPSQQVVQTLTAQGLPGAELVTAVLPVEARSAPAQLSHLLAEHRPDWCMMLGLADGRSALSFERVAINLCDFRIPDNAGDQHCDTPIAAGGPDAYFATLPLRDMVAAVRECGIPAELSLSAGAFLCNMVMYSALHAVQQQALETRCGFVHLPALPEQAALAERPIASMSLATMVAGLQVALAVLVEQVQPACA